MAVIQAWLLLAVLVFVPGLFILVHTIAHALYHELLEQGTDQPYPEFYLPYPKCVPLLLHHVLGYPEDGFNRQVP